MNEHPCRRKNVQLIAIGIILLIATCIIIILPILLTKESIQIETTSLILTSTRLTTVRTIEHLKNSTVRSWNQYGITIAGGNGQGNESNQLSKPIGIYIDDNDKNQTIYIADSGNNRIIQWKSNEKNSRIVAAGGNGINQLSNPTDIVLDKTNKSLIICDSGNARIVRWSIENFDNEKVIISNRDCFSLTIDNERYLYVSNPKENEIRKWALDDPNNAGIVVAGGNGRGENDNQLNYPTFIYLDENSSLYISDRDNKRIMKWFKSATKGNIVVQHVGNLLWDHLAQPSGIIIDRFDQIFTVDSEKNRVVRWNDDLESNGIIVVGFGKGVDVHHLNNPSDISFDKDDNIYIVDTDNHRIQKFQSSIEKNVSIE